MMQLCEKIIKFVANKIIRRRLPVFNRELAFGNYFDLNDPMSLQLRDSFENPPKVTVKIKHSYLIRMCICYFFYCCHVPI